jgi:hypothetical protein
MVLVIVFEGAVAPDRSESLKGLEIVDNRGEFLLIAMAIDRVTARDTANIRS